jgi:predicted porin
MKKSLIALAILASSGAVMAQSSVTLYGVADAFVGSKKTTSFTKDPVTQVTLSSTTRQAVVDSDGLNGSRWGLKGVEDLGSGLKAVFVLENGFGVDAGNTTTGGASMFGRQAFVGMESSSFGAVSLGRQYGAYETIRSDFLSAQGNSPTFDATNGTSFDKSIVDDTNLARDSTQPVADRRAARLRVLNNAAVGGRIGAWTGYQVRIDNSIRYATPNISGFQAAVVYGLGENKTSAVNATKNASISLSYTNGPVGVAVVHQDDEVVKDFHLKNTAIGGNYDFGVAKAFLAYNQAKYTGLAKQNEWSVGVRAPVGAATLVAQYAQSKGNDLGKNQSLGLSAEYSLSKRTTAYVGFNKTKAYDSTVNNDVFGLGVRHTF